MYLIAGALMITGSAMAQGVKLGVDAGVNLANLANQWEGETVSGQIKVGANAGVFANIPLGGHVAIQPGLRYSLKGSKIEFGYDGLNGAHFEREDKLALHYAEIPLNFVYNFGSKDSKSKFFVGAGPYLAILLDAEEKGNTKRTTGSGHTIEKETEFVSDLNIGNDAGYNNLKRTDYGAQAFVGYKLNNSWFVKAGGQMGFEEIRYENVAADAVEGYKGGETFQRNNYVFFLNVGYMFGGMKDKTAAN